MAKKKKMTPAQAAAARKDDKPKRPESMVKVKDSGPRDRGMMLIVGVTIAMIVAFTVISFAFSGMFSN
ncbi:MAG: hypothetical protein IJ087_15765 [Eggerthellaceae bacterium]|nr:hypothetical protein [Eggerthellaceae bacterium]